MSFDRKTNSDTADRPLNHLPEFPDFPDLNQADRRKLTDFWLQVREVLERQDRVLRDLITKAGAG